MLIECKYGALSNAFLGLKMCLKIPFFCGIIMIILPKKEGIKMASSEQKLRDWLAKNPEGYYELPMKEIADQSNTSIVSRQSVRSSPD